MRIREDKKEKKKKKTELTRLLSVARFRISAVSSISTIKVLLSLNRSSLAPILENNLSTIPIVAASAGTKEPICARMAIRAVCRRKVDFPAMFGPVMTCILPASEWSETELGVKTRPHVKRPTSTEGCRPLVISYTLLESPSFVSLSVFFGRCAYARDLAYPSVIVGFTNLSSPAIFAKDSATSNSSTIFEFRRRQNEYSLI